MKIAIVGSGVAGLAAARLLAPHHEIDLFEADDHVGGHVHTHEVEIEGRRTNVDTGFIVFNEVTYPKFCALLRDLGVASRPSAMGFSVRGESTGLEYAGKNLDTLFAQRSNVLRPSFLRMARDILRFHREAPALLLGAGPEIALGAWLDERGFSSSFREQYVVPMGAAIWSAAPGTMLDFPARFFVRFLHNHGMLRVDGRPQWRTVVGGSRTYVEALTRPFARHIHVRTAVRSVRRVGGSVELQLRDGPTRRFDHVVLATHSNQALDLLADPDVAEREILGAIRYQRNEAVLHTDASVMPRSRKCWSSWNYHLLDGARSPGDHPVALTYWMNLLQGLDLPTQVFVSLNHAAAIDPARVLKRITYHHPWFTRAAVAAQQRRAEIQGRRRTWFCGAYWGFGFHEDGLRSGLEVAAGIRAASAPLEVVA